MSQYVNYISIRKKGKTITLELDCIDELKADKLHETLFNALVEYDVLHLDLVLPSGTHKRTANAQG